MAKQMIATAHIAEVDENGNALSKAVMIAHQSIPFDVRQMGKQTMRARMFTFFDEAIDKAFENDEYYGKRLLVAFSVVVKREG